MKKFLIKKLVLLIPILLTVSSTTAYARIIFVDDVFENDSETYQIGSNDDAAGTPLTLEFGGLNPASITWDTNAFSFSDDIDLNQNQLIEPVLENLASAPLSPIAGQIYYNTTDTNTYIYTGTVWEDITATGGTLDHTNIVYVDSTRPIQIGEVYTTLATAITYINTQSPSSSNPWVIKVEPGSNNETVTLPFATMLEGDHRKTTYFTGIITLNNGSTLKDLTVDSGGEVYIGSGNTGYIVQSDVILGDGTNGIDGTLNITSSLVNGEIDATGVVMAYESLIGGTSITNAGILGTYNSSVFNLTDTGTWSNHGVAYDNSTLAASEQLDGATTQAAIDELVLGTPADTFTLNENQTVAEDVTLEFGNLVNEYITWDESADYFSISNSMHYYDTTSTAATEWIIFDDSSNEVSILTGTQDPSVVATDGDIGSIFLNTTTGEFYSKEDDGLTTNWNLGGLSSDLNDALLGTYGIPSITNKFVTDTDPRLSAITGAIGETGLGTHLDYDTYSNAIKNSYIYYSRIFLPTDTIIDSIGIFTTQAKANSDINLALYSGTETSPTTKLAETGTQTSVTSPNWGYWEYDLTAPYETTYAGYYWIAIATDNNPKCSMYSAADDRFIPYRIESKTAGSTTLPTTASPSTIGNTENLPYIAVFEDIL